jgi:hypothetical protein
MAAAGPRASPSFVEDLREELSNKGASWELMDTWTKDAGKDFSGTCGECVNLETRTLALQIFRRLVIKRGLSFENFGEVVITFDIFVLRAITQDALSQQQLLITCMAIVRLIEKSCCAARSRRGWGLALAADEGVDQNALSRREFEVFNVLGMRLARRPCTFEWLRIVSARFDVFSRGQLCPILTYVWGNYWRGAEMLLWTRPVSQEFTPQHIATGLFAIGLAWAGALPAIVFKPAHVTREEWAQRQNLSPLPRASVVNSPPASWQRLLQILQVASRCSMEELQAHASTVVDALAAIADAGFATQPMVESRVELTHNDNNRTYVEV